MKQTFLILANICLLTIISGCVAPAPREPQTTTISCRVPTITPLPETKPSQEKGGLEITIVPANYKAARQDKHVVTPTEPNFGEVLLAPTKSVLGEILSGGRGHRCGRTTKQNYL